MPGGLIPPEQIKYEGPPPAGPVGTAPARRRKWRPVRGATPGSISKRCWYGEKYLPYPGAGISAVPAGGDFAPPGAGDEFCPYCHGETGSTPHFLFVLPKRKRAVDGPKEKGAFS